MKIKTSELTGAALDWAVAKCEGKVLPKPKTATYEQFINSPTPFHLWEVNYHWENKLLVNCSVTPIEVTRVGVDSSVGASAPSISFKDVYGEKCRGSISMYYVTKDDAELESQRAMIGADLEFQPSTDWKDGGPIIEGEKITLIRCEDKYAGDAKGFTTNIRITVWAAAHGGGYSIQTQYEGENYPPQYEVTESDCVYGSTPLIAAMRCYVKSKLGDEIELPKELQWIRG